MHTVFGKGAVVGCRKIQPAGHPHHPAYDISGPAPSICTKTPAEGFFRVPFHLWMPAGVSCTNEVCRPVRQHELTVLLSISKEATTAFLKAPWETLLAWLRCAPGRQGLEVLFTVIKALEDAIKAHNMTEEDKGIKPNAH
eukprot:11869540-Ditylum_brightwellii.AAC.1